MPTKHLVILNPSSRNGATGRRWRQIEPRLRAKLPDLQVGTTLAPRDAERIAREGARDGIRRIIVAGGDGTTSEVVTGLLAAGLGGEVEIGFLPLGTGGDFARTLAVPRDIDAAIDLLSRAERRRVDAGRVTYRDRSGAIRTSYFLNVASLGISGLTDELVNRAPKSLGGTISFLIGTLRGIVRYRCAHVRLCADGELVHDGPLILAACANGRYFGGGMKIAPAARVDDGELDLVVVGQVSKARLIAQLPLLYRGTHIGHPEVSVQRAKKIEAEAPPGQVWLDVDGEALGTLPATIEVLPGAITLFGVTGSTEY